MTKDSPQRVEYSHFDRKVGSRNVLGVLIDSYPDYRSQLRPDSLKTFVAVSDDDATSQPIDSADAFMSAVQKLEPQNPQFWSSYHYSSIYCFSQCDQASAVGTVHADLVAKTHGVGGDLCLQNFKPVFDALAHQVLLGTKLACDWAIPAPPVGEKFDAGKTNVQLTLDGTLIPIDKAAQMSECLDHEAWHYDNENAPARVVACPASCARIQAANNASVDILFGCETRFVRPPD